MQEGTRKKVGNGGERNKRMRPDVNTSSRWKSSRSEVIEKDEGSNHLPCIGRQHPANHEAAEIALARVNQLYDCHLAHPQLKVIFTVALELPQSLANHSLILETKDVQTP